MKKKAYRSIEIQKVVFAQVLAALVTPVVILALDVAKRRVLGAVADALGQVHSLVHFALPEQLPLFLDLARQLREQGRTVQIVMEPTGSYSSPILHAAHAAGVDVFLVNPKRAHDAAEVYDGVPSKHDPKDAAVLAWLHAQGRSKRWTPLPESRRELRALLDERDLYAIPLDEHFGRVEARLAEWWPELLQVVAVRERISVLRWLVTYADPARVRAEPAKATAALRKLSRGAMETTTLDAIVASAQNCKGASMLPAEQTMLVRLFEEVVRLHDHCAEVETRLGQVLDTIPNLAPVTAMLGAVTTSVVWARVGDPKDYSSASALEKACGLNLKESSSGERQGHGIHLTKRGPGVVRKYLYLLALRVIGKDPVVRAWYERRRGFVADTKVVAVVAVMRKLVRALWHVARGNAFDATKLFDVRRWSVATKGSATTTRATEEVLA